MTLQALAAVLALIDADLQRIDLSGYDDPARVYVLGPRGVDHLHELQHDVNRAIQQAREAGRLAEL